jgi:phosphoribosylformylglycinamidine cyclo-ligase
MAAFTTQWDRTWSNHCVNDILVQGAQPLFFLDYIGYEQMDGAIVHSIISGMTEGLRGQRLRFIGG